MTDRIIPIPAEDLERLRAGGFTEQEAPNAYERLFVKGTVHIRYLRFSLEPRGSYWAISVPWSSFDASSTSLQDALHLLSQKLHGARTTAARALSDINDLLGDTFEDETAP